MAKKSVCPVTRSEFRGRARPVTVTIGDVPMAVPTKEFSTGSFGWYLNGEPLRNGIQWGNCALLLGLAAIFAAVGIWQFNRRDLTA